MRTNNKHRAYLKYGRLFFYGVMTMSSITETRLACGIIVILQGSQAGQIGLVIDNGKDEY